MFFGYNRLDRQTGVIRSLFARFFLRNDKPFNGRDITPVY